jgi:epoxyqueuosine reductase QueG
VKQILEAGGFNLTGPLPGDEYDRLVPPVWRIGEVCPGARSVLVVGNAGRALWPRFRASPEFRERRNPLDRYTERIFRAAVARIAAPSGYAFYTEKRQDRYLPLVALAQRAGFGSPGRVGVLLHPEYGPWISIRGALFLPEEVPRVEIPPFDPCTGCPAPCVSACHGGAVSEAGVDILRCFRTKVTRRACRAACDARSACVIGPEHAFPPEQIAHHSRIRWRPSTLRRAAVVLLRPSSGTK